MRCEPVGEEGRFEEDGTMKVVEDADSKKMLDQRKKVLKRQLRDLEKLTKMPQDIQSWLKAEWQQEHQDIEQKRNLLPEHQRTQKRSQAALHFGSSTSMAADPSSSRGVSRKI